jgi:hypothetical protein
MSDADSVHRKRWPRLGVLPRGDARFARFPKQARLISQHDMTSTCITDCNVSIRTRDEAHIEVRKNSRIQTLSLCTTESKFHTGVHDCAAFAAGAAFAGTATKYSQKTGGLTP